MIGKFVRSLLPGRKPDPAPAEPLDLLREVRPWLWLPEGHTEKQLFEFVTSIRLDGAPEAELLNYGVVDFRRFVYTCGLAADLKGRCLELGANPYFTTLLMKTFTGLSLELANYFDANHGETGTHRVHYRPPNAEEDASIDLAYRHFNIETQTFPWEGGSFEVVVFAEILEHLTIDACRVLREIKRVLADDGVLILTTPNVARLENLAQLAGGANIYDPYSAYGPYGRHNREYNLHEVVNLLRFEGFEIESAFTADVHGNIADQLIAPELLEPLVRGRMRDLGQYIFIKARSARPTPDKRPSWLYRSYPADWIEEVAL